MRICQLINLVAALFLISCSSQRVDETRDQRLITASWLKIPVRFAQRDKDDNFLTHPFFDINPSLNKEKRTINFFVTTPEESAFKYNIDLYSGRLYGEHEFCATDDVWESYTGEIEKPNFTQGIVPQTYDQNGDPQRIVIFGMPKTDPKDLKAIFHPQYFETGKLVGSLLLETCDSYPCDLKSKWKGTQILLAVNPSDDRRSFAKVNLLNELRSKTDWTYVKAMLTNQDGVHQVGKKYFPGFRISKEMGLEESLRYFEKNSKLEKLEELVKWREDCFKLYDDFWEKSEKIREQKRDQQFDFLKLFKEFYSKSSDKFYSCSKLVRPGTINEDPRRLWFFAYVQAFTNLEKNQFYYSCSNKAWSYNPKVTDNQYFNNQIKELERCRAKNFEKSFDQAINGLSLMRAQTNKEFRFIEYDNGRAGSHQKLYSWIGVQGKSLMCKNKKGLFKKADADTHFNVFPQDVVWEGFVQDEDKSIK